MDIEFGKNELPKSGNIVVIAKPNLTLPKQAASLDKALDSAITNAISKAKFKGKKGQCLTVVGNTGKYDSIVVLGTDGDKDKDFAKESDLEALGGQLYAYLEAQKVNKFQALVDKIGKFPAETVAAHMAYGAELRSYRFDKYFTKKTEEEKPTLTGLSFCVDNHTKAAKTYRDTLKPVASGIFFARNLVTEPSNVLNPVTYSEKCKELKKLGIKVEVLGEKQMAKLGMHSLLGVGQGSVHESKLVIMQWDGRTSKKKSDTPLAFVGKGVTFDTGGISIKPSLGMEDMKYDMAGSAAVVGLMKALAERKAKVHAVGVVGLVENMPGGEAQRPGDVVTSMSGQTIEVLNTDAEGRLVLADALWYTQKRFKPQFMIDLATLTGAMVIALGVHRAGIFSNNDTLSENLYKSGETSSERVWRLPMGPEYDKQMDSKIADMQNISNMKGAGSITAAQFLQRFVNNVPWVHIDIAGVAWANKPLDTVPEGASAFGIRLLNQLVSDYYEK